MKTPILRQAGCVSIGGRGILIEGPPGSGKTSLALMLLDRGARLVGDDGVLLSIRHGRLWASPPPNTAGKLEIRGVGIVDLPAMDAPVSLWLDISQLAPRYVENAATKDLLGAAIPALTFDARGGAAAIRAEYALALHGLPLPAHSGTGSRGPSPAPESPLPLAPK
jgi:serine kinase of HPr protein (carbohydrate metabolism regulator)